MCRCVGVWVCGCVGVYVCTCARVHVCTCARVHVCTCARCLSHRRRLLAAPDALASRTDANMKSQLKQRKKQRSHEVIVVGIAGAMPFACACQCIRAFCGEEEEKDNVNVTVHVACASRRGCGLHRRPSLLFGHTGFYFSVTYNLKAP